MPMTLAQDRHLLNDRSMQVMLDILDKKAKQIGSYTFGFILVEIKTDQDVKHSPCGQTSVIQVFLHLFANFPLFSCSVVEPSTLPNLLTLHMICMNAC